MTRYNFSLNDGSLVVRYVDEYGREGVLENEDMYALIGRLISRGYVVKKYTDAVVLKGKRDSVRIEDYINTLEDPHLVRLKKDLKLTVKRDGYIDGMVAQHAKRKPNRQKSKNYVGSIVKVGAVMVLLVSIVEYANGRTGEIVIEDDHVVSANSEVLPLASQNKISVARMRYDSSLNQVEKDDHETEIEIVNSEESQDIELDDISEELVKSVEASDHSIEHSSFVDAGSNEISTDIMNTVEMANVPLKLMEFGDRSQTDKAIYARSNYYDTFCVMGKAFGLDPELLLAMGTQEKGFHEAKSEADGGYGLMQIQFDGVWKGETINCYKLNEETGHFEPYKIVVTEEKIQTVEGNIEVACAIFQTYLLRFANYNIPLAVQMYNQGPGALKTIVNAYCEDTGKRYEDVINDPSDLGWTDYCHLRAGDPKYLAKVKSWTAENTFKVTNVSNYDEVEFSFASVKKL